jgi:hypothetical protein
MRPAMTENIRQSFSLNGPSIALDAETHAVRGDLADIALAGKLFVPHYAKPMPMQATADGVCVHADADKASNIVATLSAGHRFMAVDMSGGWVWGFVADTHKVGYVPQDQLDRDA